MRPHSGRNGEGKRIALVAGTKALLQGVVAMARVKGSHTAAYAKATACHGGLNDEGKKRSKNLFYSRICNHHGRRSLGVGGLVVAKMEMFVFV